MLENIQDIRKKQSSILRILLHLFVWVLVWMVVRYFSIPILTKDNNAVIEHASIVIFVQSLLIFYSLGYVGLPKLLYQKKFLWFLLFFFALCEIVHASNYFDFQYLFSISDKQKSQTVPYIHQIWINHLKKKGLFSVFTDFSVAYFNYAWSFFYVTPILFVKIMRDVSRFRTINLELERDRLVLEVENLSLNGRGLELQNENIALELNYLKSQISPHFLFNILNSIYTITWESDPIAADLILKLSDLMRYNLYESSKETLPLSREVEHLQNYITLEKSRKSEEMEIEFTAIGDFLDHEISPLLLISFVENAFKHGVANAYKQSFVSIFLKLSGDQLDFSVKNSILPKSKFSRTNKVKVGGLGIENTRRRLNLLYPDRYQLEIQQQDNKFQVVLSITLAKCPSKNSAQV